MEICNIMDLESFFWPGTRSWNQLYILLEWCTNNCIFHSISLSFHTPSTPCYFTPQMLKSVVGGSPGPPLNVENSSSMVYWLLRVIPLGLVSGAMSMIIHFCVSFSLLQACWWSSEWWYSILRCQQYEFTHRQYIRVVSHDASYIRSRGGWGGT